MNAKPLYSILELHKLSPEELKVISDHYELKTEGQKRQITIYAILDAQDQQIKIEQ